MTDVTEMPKYDGMEYEELVVAAQYMWMENAKLREERDHWRVEQVHAYGNWEDTYKRASELEAENAKLREQSARLFDKTLELGTENEKLRELVRKWYPHMLKRVGRDALEQWGQMEVVKELGIEVDA